LTEFTVSTLCADTPALPAEVMFCIIAVTVRLPGSFTDQEIEFFHDCNSTLQALENAENVSACTGNR
jgi:hypothetical protein